MFSETVQPQLGNLVLRKLKAAGQKHCDDKRATKASGEGASKKASVR